MANFGFFTAYRIAVAASPADAGGTVAVSRTADGRVDTGITAAQAAEMVPASPALDPRFSTMISGPQEGSVGAKSPVNMILLLAVAAVVLVLVFKAGR